MADGGSINLRMSLKGAEQVRAELASLGPAGSRAARDLDRAMRTPGPALSALDMGMKEARSGVDALAGRTGPLAAGLGQLGVAGTAAAAGVAVVLMGVAEALKQTREAVAFADEIEDSANKINIGVEALQEWRFAAVEAGGAATDADQAIDGFQKKLGEGMAGGRSVKWFERLGFGREDLKAFGSTEAAMNAVIDKIAGLSTEAERAAVAEKLGLGPLIPVIREGGAAIDAMRAKARELGVVMDEEMVRRGAQSAREMEVLSQVIDMQLKQAFIDLGPVLVQLLGLVADLARALRGLADDWKRVEDRSNEAVARTWQRADAEQRRLLRTHGPTVADLGPSERAAYDRATELKGRAQAEMEARGRAANSRPAPAGPPVHLRDVSGGGRGATDAQRAAERLAREQERLADELARQLIAAQRTALQAPDDATPEERARLARELLAIDRKERDAKVAALEAELSEKQALDDAAAAQIAQLRALNQQADAAADAAVSAELLAAQEDARLKIADGIAAAEDRYLEVTGYILELASSHARTADERRAIEAQLLEISQRKMEADLRAAIEAEKEPEARARLVAALERLPQLFAAQADDMARRTAGPVEGWWNDQRTAGQVGEFIQGEALGALDGLNGGLVDVFMNAESASDAFDRMGDVAVNALKRVTAALLEIALQRWLIQPLAGALFGDGTSGSQGLLGGLFQGVTGAVFGGPAGASPTSIGAAFMGRTPGRAGGGRMGAGGRVLVGEKGMELIDLPAGAYVHNDMQAERILAGHDRMMMDQAHAVRGGPASVSLNQTVRVINQTDSPVQAKTRMTPDGLDVILSPLIRTEVARMGGDGSLGRLTGSGPKLRRR